MVKAATLVLGLLAVSASAAPPVAVVRNSKILQFSYEWPSEAAAIPALNRRFRSDMERAYQHHLALAREDAKDYREQGRGSVSDFYSMKWTSTGETARLLSLTNQLSTYTGGAHPNTGYSALLWDRQLGREMAVSALLRTGEDLRALTGEAYCKALDAERQKRRGGDQPSSLSEFDKCPDFSDLAIAPLDSDGDGRFDSLDFIASPYTAGPYSEGEYEIPVPVRSALLSALRPEFRRSFESHSQ